MRNFPVPYPNELVYSTIARAAVYHGITSPKHLLDEVFENRKVIATLDLPCHLNAIHHQLMKTGRFTVEEIAYRHTLFPMYAPFVPESHRLLALDLMKLRSQGAIHLLLGVSASRVKSSDQFRYCPECLVSQYQNYGEHYWQRSWFLPSLAVCAAHGVLKSLMIGAGSHRHQFIALDSILNEPSIALPVDVQLLRLAKDAEQILLAPADCSPSALQWTCFYRELASDLGFCRGKHIRHDEIYALVKHQIRPDLLAYLNLDIQRYSDTSWLRSIFRKHRKAFSYLEHLVVWQTLLHNVHPLDILQRVRSTHTGSISMIPRNPIERTEQRNTGMHRERWQLAVEAFGLQDARTRDSGGATYAWLYRHDRTWLLGFNAKKRSRPVTSNVYIDWHGRDLKIVRKLIKQHRNFDDFYVGPRLSAIYLLSKFHNKTSIEKNLFRLPLVRMFLTRYAETTTEYQLRRLTCAARLMSETGNTLKKWSLFRKAGLSTERLTSHSQKVLQGLNWF